MSFYNDDNTEGDDSSDDEEHILIMPTNKRFYGNAQDPFLLITHITRALLISN